jgi:catechol 2,3-dioxygenase-like lactoylglutathione lyase family enzyme
MLMRTRGRTNWRSATRRGITARAFYDRYVPRIERAHFILYVAEQQRSSRFYTAALDMEPELDVPGMTEFRLGASAVLGLMPTEAIKRLLPGLPDLPDGGAAPPRAELYLVVDHPIAAHQRALDAGARELSPVVERDWGHVAGYSLDPDGHVVAFAR